MRNVNIEEVLKVVEGKMRFILTMRNVNSNVLFALIELPVWFILTMRNVNKSIPECGAPEG